MKLIIWNVILVVLLVGVVNPVRGESSPVSDADAAADPNARASANPDPFPMPAASPNPNADPGIITDMLGRGEDLVRQFMPTGLTIAGMVERFIPTPENVMKLAKGLLIELPQEIVLFAIQSFCTSAISNNVLNPQNLPNMAEMNFVYKGPNGEVVARLDDSEKIWSHRDFKRDWPTVMLITGWNSNVNNTNLALDILYAAYRTRDINFVFFDTAKFVDTLYTWSAFNTKGLGEIIGQALSKFVKYVPVEKIQLIGHSLGAHICGFAGRTFTNITDQYLPRITGLDPARPCFNQGQQLDGLSRGDAAFVEIIHTNAGALGKRQTMGDVDYWPNGHSSLQPGCLTLVCSHSRSFEYYAESVIRGNEYNFMAVRCSSYNAYVGKLCDGKPVPMGFASPSTAKGDFYLTTRRLPPFGMKSNTLSVASRITPIDFHN